MSMTAAAQTMVTTGQPLTLSGHARAPAITH